MANINIYGTLFSDLFQDNEKVIVLGSQVYCNKINQNGEEEAVLSEDDNNNWTAGLAKGNQYDINRYFKKIIDSLSGKINTVTNPLKFKGVIPSTDGQLTTLPVKGVEVGDVYHLNANIDPYHTGDDVVCINVTKAVEGIGGVQVQDEITWELLGRNTVDVTRIDPTNITIGNLESSSTI